MKSVLRRLPKTALIASLLLLVSSCSPYASVDIGVPFRVGPVTVNPSIGVGSFL